MRQVTKVILSHKLTGTAAEKSAGVVLAAGMSPPSLLPHFSEPGAGGASGSGLLGQHLQAERWLIEPRDNSGSGEDKAPIVLPGSSSRGASLAPGPAPAYRVLPAPSGSKIPLALLLDVSKLSSTAGTTSPAFFNFLSHFSPRMCTKKNQS